MRERGLVALGWTAALAVAAIMLVLAACGGGATTAPPTATIAVSASPGASLIPKQGALPGQFPDLKNEGEPLATLVSQKELGSDKIRAAITSDPQFAETEALGVKAGFGPAEGGVELQYDNGMTVTAALMTSPDKGITLAARESGAQPVYAVLHLAGDGRTLTAYHHDSTITVDLKTLKGGAVDTPEAHHSCRVGHCFYAAVVYLFNSWGFGTALKAVCGTCIAAAAALPPTAGASAIVALPACIGCVPLLASMGIAAFVDCEIDPCDYCANDSCGEPPSEYYELCTNYNAPPDPTTRSTAGVNGIRAGYRCEGVDVSLFPPSVDYSATQCINGSEVVGLVRACPLGCAPPAPGDTVSRDCNLSPACVGDADCPAAQVLSQVCANDADGGGVVTYQVKYYDCRGGLCTSHQFPSMFDCTPVGITPLPPPVPCAADNQSCEGEPVGDVRCVVRASDGKSIEERDYRYRTCSLSPQGWTLDCGGETTVSKLVRECPGECLADGTGCGPTCDPASCRGEETYLGPRCAYNYSRYVVEQTFRQEYCKDLATGGAECATRDETRVVEVCPYGCTAAGTVCAARGTVPAAPGDFLVLEGGPGTAFSWTDNSDNEEGFRIYYGSRSLGRPSTLIGTAPPQPTPSRMDTVALHLEWERPEGGSDVCWEVYAYNAAGESAPAHYCTGF